MTFPVVGSNIPSVYQIDNSLRFNDNDSPLLTFTPSSTRTDAKKCTLSFWFKLGSSFSTFRTPFRKNDGTFTGGVYVRNGDNLQFFDNNFNLRTSALRRDASAWYHFFGVYDSTQATASDRVSIYVNGIKQTDFELTPTYPSLNTNHDFLINTVPYFIGGDGYSNDLYWDGYLAEFNFIDGQALSPTDFGEFDEDSGVWKPKQYAGTYGTNGFYLKFNNTGNMGEDSSGNDNTFTPTNLSGTTDVTTDTPTNNFATLNPLSFIFENSAGTLSEGNLKHTNTGGDSDVVSTIGISSGKFYAEFKAENALSDRPAIAVYNNYDNGSATSRNLNGSVLFLQDGRILVNNSSIGDFGSISQNDIIQVAVDNDNGAIYIGQNGTYLNSGDPTSGSSRTGSVSNYTAGSVTSFIGCRCNSGSIASANFGNPAFSISSGNSDDNGYGNFEYAPPSGYLALCTQNLATVLSPTIDDGSQYFNTVLYTGTGTTQSITGVGFQPDLVWLKDRDLTYDHQLHDSNRGASAGYLASNNTNAENPTYPLSSFDSDGWTTVSGGTPGQNASGDTFVAWNWKAGGTGVTNTDGSITSTVSANPTSGFSIVSYSLNTTSIVTVGHGLSQAPQLIINKGRNIASTWWTFTTVIDGSLDYLPLNDTSAAVNETLLSLPTSTVFSIVQNYTYQQPVMSYCFHSVEGYSKIGIYTGTGNSDGPYIHLGFRPSFLIGRRINATSNWIMYDSKRNTFNDVDNQFFTNQSNVESTTTTNNVDFLSNGFKVRGSGGTLNGNGSTIIYMCFAENPFVTSTGIPVVAR